MAAVSRSEIEDFLYAEANLLDERRFDEWLELFAEDAVYWVPAGAGDAVAGRDVSIVHDDRSQLAERVWRLDSGLAYAQEPASRTSHLVGNVEVGGDDDDGREEELIRVRSRFVVSEFRRDRLNSYAGRCTHWLRPSAQGLTIRLKRVDLINSDGHLGNLSILL